VEERKITHSSDNLPPGELLDSWKEIASYLKKGIRTVQRWEAEEGLPIYRQRHDRFASVYALRSEIDEWKARRTEKVGKKNSGGDLSANLPGHERPISVPSRLAGFSERLRGRWFVSLVAVALTVLLMAIAGWIYVSSKPKASQVASLTYEKGELRAHDGRGRVMWSHSLPEIRYTVGDKTSGGMPGNIKDVNRDGSNEVLACVTSRVGASGFENGEVYCFNSEGKSLWQFAPNDTLRFANTDYGPPWAIANWSAHETSGDVAIAVAVHHFTLWPSMLILLNGDGRVLGRFVNSGWIVTSQWLPRPSGLVLLVGGISNSRSMGMMAVLDAKNISGHSPEEEGSEFECNNCPPGGLVRYFVLPRSELNIATTSQYNRVDAFQIFSDRLVAYSIEVDAQHAESRAPIFADYEFSLDLELKRAYFDDKYWDLHRRLEADGRIKHSRADCPDRDGPRLVRPGILKTAGETFDSAAIPLMRERCDDSMSIPVMPAPADFPMFDPMEGPIQAEPNVEWLRRVPI
jgi:hypothetical protein